MYKKKLRSLVILIPSYNELINLKRFIIKLNKEYNVLVIDDYSIDGTFSWLKKNKINVRRNKKNVGYEKSILNGFNYILKNKNYKYLLTMDADGQHLKSDIKKFLFKNIYMYDVVVGLRKEKNRFIEKIISYYFSKFYDIKDPLSGFKLYKLKFLKKINMNNISNLFLVDLLLENLTKGAKIKNINIKTNRRIDKSRVGSYVVVTLKMLKIFFYLLKKRIH